MNTVKVRAKINILGLASGEEAELEVNEDVERMLRFGYWVELVPCQDTQL